MNDHLFTRAGIGAAALGIVAFIGSTFGWFGKQEWAASGAAFSAGALALVLNMRSWKTFSEIFVHTGAQPADGTTDRRSVKPRVYTLIALKILFVLLIVGLLAVFGGRAVIPALLGYGLALFSGLVLGILFPEEQGVFHGEPNLPR